MTKIRIVRHIGAALAVLVAGGCKTLPTDDPEPVTRIVEVKVQVPVPCPALQTLGAEPIYPDTEQAIAEAPDIAALAVLFKVGRILRTQRLAEYEAAKTACSF
jgi:hypothetical protein